MTHGTFVNITGVPRYVESPNSSGVPQGSSNTMPLWSSLGITGFDNVGGIGFSPDPTNIDPGTGHPYMVGTVNNNRLW
jgi:hypothetical protein